MTFFPVISEYAFAFFITEKKLPAQDNFEQKRDIILQSVFAPVILKVLSPCFSQKTEKACKKGYVIFFFFKKFFMRKSNFWK